MAKYVSCVHPRGDAGPIIVPKESWCFRCDGPTTKCGKAGWQTARDLRPENVARLVDEIGIPFRPRKHENEVQYYVFDNEDAARLFSQTYFNPVIRQATGRTLFGLPVHECNRLAPGTALLLTVDHIAYTDGQFERDQCTLVGPMRVLNEPFKIVTGDDLKLLEQMKTLRAAQGRQEHWRAEHKRLEANENNVSGQRRDAEAEMFKASRDVSEAMKLIK